jgi:HEPN domain-containing protein
MVTITDAKEIAKVLAGELAPVAVIAFGSVARSGKGSDLDLLVVTENEIPDGDVSRSLRPFQKNFPIDHFTTSAGRLTDQFRKGSPFLTMIQKEGRILYMKDAIKEWIDLAVEDLRQARYLLGGGFYRGACFAAQQAVEKGIKAELLKRGWELEKIHHIRRLLHILEEFNLHVQYEEDDVDFLDSIYRGRYPAEEGLLPLKPPVDEDASRSIAVAEALVAQLPSLAHRESN